MASLRDLLFGAGVLKKVADGPQPDQNSAPPANPSGIDIAAEANKAAARAKAAVTTPAPQPAAPLVKPPVKPKPATAAGAIGTALKGAQ